jgi:hypothetical protein
VVSVRAKRPDDPDPDPADGADGWRARVPLAGGDRGQAYTLEGVASTILVLTGLLFALQAIVLTPTTPGTIDRDTRAELAEQADDVLLAAHSNGSLSATARYYNWSTGGNITFYNPDPDNTTVSQRFGYGQDDPPTELGALMNQTFSQRGLSYNIFLDYQTVGDVTNREREVLVKQGVPTDNSVSTEIVVTLYDDQRITAPTEDPPNSGSINRSRLSDLNASAGEFYAPDAHPGPMYNQLIVRVVIW